MEHRNEPAADCRLCRVLEIYEADFGCEGRPEGQETLVYVRMQETDRCEDGKDAFPEHTLRIADQKLYDDGIEEGDIVLFDLKNKTIAKIKS